MGTESVNIEKPLGLNSSGGKLKHKGRKPKVAVQNNVFNCKTGNEWIESAKKLPKMESLGSLEGVWHTSEIGFLVGETGSGKSLFAVQTAVDICNDGKTVLYCDLELSQSQFLARYTNKLTEQSYKFPDNFHRIEFADNEDIPDNVDATDYLIACLDQHRVKSEAEVIIIDNIIWLTSNVGTAKDALPLLKKFKKWQRASADKDQNYAGFSLLVLCHTPKRPMNQPLTINDIFGSSMQANFCDAAVGIGKSILDPHFRYLKQLKVRIGEFIYHAENVIQYTIDKREDGYTHFKDDFKFCSESEHLRKEIEAFAETLEDKWKEAYELYQNNPDNGVETKGSYSAVGRYMMVSHVTARKYVNKWKAKLEKEAKEKDNKINS